MGNRSRLSSECRKCPFASKCSKKRMVAEAYIEPKVSANVAVPSVAELVQPMAVKHDYRDIKIAEGVTITIDVEELKEQMQKGFYRKMGIGFYPGE